MSLIDGQYIISVAAIQSGYWSMNDGNVSLSSSSGKGRSLQPDKVMLVQCKGFKCMAVRDGKGVWRDRQGQILSNVIKIIQEADADMLSVWNASIGARRE